MLKKKFLFSIQFYNDTILDFNNKIKMLLSNIIFEMFGFKAAEFLNIDNNKEREALKVSF